MESFADYMQAFAPLPRFTALGRSDKVPQMSLVDLVRLVLDPFDCKEALQGWDARHF